MSIYKLFLGVLITGLLFFLSPIILVRIGWIPELIDKYWIILILTGFGLVIKMFVSDSITSDFQFHKFGYDNSIIAFGGVLTALVFQITANYDCFPGLNSSPLDFLSSFIENVINLRITQLILIFLMCLIAILTTSRISKSINEDGTKYKGLLAFINSIIGSFGLAFYIYILILKP